MKKQLPTPRDQDHAFILVTALILISAMVIIALSILSTARLQNSVTQFNYQNTRGELAVTPKLVPRLAFEHAAQGNDYVVLRVDVDGDGDPLTPEETYFYTARFDGSQWEYRPLFSGGKIPEPTDTLILPTPEIEANTETEDIAGTQVAAQSALRIPQNQFGSPRIGWERLAADEQTLPGDSELGEAELFYAYWIEDLSARIDADVAGNSRGIPTGSSEIVEDYASEDGFHYRGRGADASEIALFTLFDPTITEDGPQGTNDGDNLIQTIRGQEADLAEPFVNTILGAARSGAYPAFSAPPAEQWSGTETEPGIKDFLSFGTPEWTDRVEYVPERPGFVHLDGNGNRIPKLALNALIRRAESGLVEREAAIREIALHILKCLPQFASSRRGGNDLLYAGNPLSDEEYLHTLAANIIDYADRDFTPSVGWDPARNVPEDEQVWSQDRSTTVTGGENIPDTTIGNRGWDNGDVFTPLYRGIDGQPFLIGLTNQLEYDIVKSRERSQGGVPTVVVDVSTLIVVWNPFDFPISGKVSARLTEGWTTVKWGQARPRLPHLNLSEPGGLPFVTLQPNEFRVLPWIDHTELESEGSGSTLPSSINIDDFGYKLFEAGYQLYWCDEELWTNWSNRGFDGSPRVFLADRSRFPDIMNRDFRRFVSQGEWWYFSSGLGDSSQNPLPVPFSSLYSAGNVARSGRAYVRSAYINNLFFFSGGAPKTSYGDLINPGKWGDQFPPFSETEYGRGISREADIFTLLEPTMTMDPDKAPLTVKRYPEDYSSFPLSYREEDYASLPAQRDPSSHYEELPGAAEYVGPGYYESLTELGNVYDPGCWIASWMRNPNLDRPKGGPITLSSSHLGLGSTLKIGEPEYTNFDQPGIRAQDLLELFVLDYPNQETAKLADPAYVANYEPLFPAEEWRTSRKARINVNTASPEVLRALVAGLRVENPWGTAGDEWLYPRSSERIGDEFAKALIAYRPFASSILSSTSFAQNFLNDPALTYQDFDSDSFLSSRSREAFIDSLTNLTTVTSRVFRVHLSTYVVDRKRQSTGTDFRQIVSRKARVYDLFLEPQYDEAGEVTGQKLIVFHEKDL